MTMSSRQSILAEINDRRAAGGGQRVIKKNRKDFVAKIM
jgi:hypothetical protein